MEVKSISQVIDSNNRCHQTGNRPTTINVIASQWFVVLAVNCLAFNFGIFERFYQAWMIRTQNIDLLSNYTFYLIMPCLGIVVFTFLGHCFGSRLTLLIGSALVTISWLIIYFAIQLSTVLAAFYIYHTTKVLVLTTGITYVAEVTEPQLRSLSIVTTIILHYLGYYVFDHSEHLSRNIIILYLIFPVLGLIGFSIAPESPHWLASKYKFEKVEASLAWIRGWTTPANVKSEFSSLKINQEMPFVVTACNKASSIVCCMYIIYMFTGTTILRIFYLFLFDFYSLSMLEFARIEKIFVIISFVGPISCMPLVYFLGKRKLVSVSLIVSGFSFLILTVNEFLKGDGTVKLHGSMATIILFMIIFVDGMGITPIVYILNTELFPSRYRHFGVGIGRLLELILQTIFKSYFLDILNDISIKVILLFFTIICTLAFGIFYYTIPETEGRILTDIEKHYKGIQKLDDRTRQNNGIEQGNSHTMR